MGWIATVSAQPCPTQTDVIGRNVKDADKEKCCNKTRMGRIRPGARKGSAHPFPPRGLQSCVPNLLRAVPCSSVLVEREREREMCTVSDNTVQGLRGFCNSHSLTLTDTLISKPHARIWIGVHGCQQDTATDSSRPERFSSACVRECVYVCVARHLPAHKSIWAQKVHARWQGGWVGYGRWDRTLSTHATVTSWGQSPAESAGSALGCRGVESEEWSVGGETLWRAAGAHPSPTQITRCRSFSFRCEVRGERSHEQRQACTR